MRNKIVAVPLILYILIQCLSFDSFSFIKGTSLSIGGVYDVDSSTPFVVLKNDLESGDFIFGTAIIAKGEKELEGYESIVLDYLEYNNGTKGLFYGQLDSVRYGSGLLLNDFNTTYAHPVFLSNKNRALRSYYYMDYCTLNMFKTNDNLYGINIDDLYLFGTNFGIEYVSEADGIKGFSEEFSPYTCAYGISFISPTIIADCIRMYGEYASVNEKNSGVALGVSCDYNLFFMPMNLRAEGRSLDKGFFPGYFSPDYDVNPVNLSSYEASDKRREGTLVSLGSSLFGFLAFRTTYENYTGGNETLSYDFIITPVSGLDITGFSRQPTFTRYRQFPKGDTTMVGGSVLYRVGQISLSANYKKAPLPEDIRSYETSYVEMAYRF